MLIHWKLKKLLRFEIVTSQVVHPVYATCCSKVMALLLRNTFFIFTCLFLLYHWSEPGQNMKKHKMIYELNMYMNHILICLLVIKLGSIKFTTYSQRIVSLSFMKITFTRRMHGTTALGAVHWSSAMHSLAHFSLILI